MAERVGAKGLVIAAPRSGSGKTALTLAIARALAERGLAVAPAKTGPDYIDPRFLALAARSEAINLDPWAMEPEHLRALAQNHCENVDVLLIEGVMGLFDGAVSGQGSTADLAAALDLPIVLVLDCRGQAQSVAALVSGFANWRSDSAIAGVILNRVGSTKHEAMLRAAIAATGVPVLGAIPEQTALALPERHLGLVLPDEIEGIEAFFAHAGALASTHIDLDALIAATGRIRPGDRDAAVLPPLGQHIAIAHDRAFAFVYPHLLAGWQASGARLSFFSPLADQAPAPDADAIFLPGGYPELHGATLANAQNFTAGVRAAAARGTLIYGECGGFMVLGRALTTRTGERFVMTGLLGHETFIDKPRRVLGYRKLSHTAPLPWPEHVRGHEFHYSSAHMEPGAEPLFMALDAAGNRIGAMGQRKGTVMGSYAHVICAGGAEP